MWKGIDKEIRKYPLIVFKFNSDIYYKENKTLFADSHGDQYYGTRAYSWYNKKLYVGTSEWTLRGLKKWSAQGVTLGQWPNGYHVNVYSNKKGLPERLTIPSDPDFFDEDCVYEFTVMKTNLDWAGYFMTMSHRMAKCTSEEQMSC